MIIYCIRLFKQIRKLYRIKQHIDIIHQADINHSTHEIQQKNYESLKQIIFESGSLYIKFFQWYISKLKANIVNPQSEEALSLSRFIHYFEDIFEQCPYHDIEHTKVVFEESMEDGTTLEEYIDMETFQPIASGSIGQVYYGVRRVDGKAVAIKVKHPNIESDLAEQNELISLIKFLQSYKYLRNRYKLFFNIDDFLYDINLQCDFNNEADNVNKFRDNFKASSSAIVFPEVYYQSSDLLISEYIVGEEFNSLTSVQKQKTAMNFVCFVYQMLLVDNFVHGDLHCKNWKVRKNPNNENNIQIVVYDCGICFQNISCELSNKFWFSIVKYDIEKVIEVLKVYLDNINSNTSNQFNIDLTKFEEDIRTMFNKIIKESLGTGLVVKSILNFFSINDITIHKFLLNFSIFVCVIEEFLKTNEIIDKDRNENKVSSMFDIITDNELDVIAYCDVKKCYPKVRQLLSKNMEDKYNVYQNNISRNNINENVNSEKKLFSSLVYSGLTFKPPE
jgi:predicted unusual protein kinase regulating ubiquinone biosynthesis (AarF/ABC1/UbiB family)